MYPQSLVQQGVNTPLIQAAKKRADVADKDILHIEGYTNEVVEFQRVKREFVDPLDSLRPHCRNAKESLDSRSTNLSRLEDRHQQAMEALRGRQNILAAQS